MISWKASTQNRLLTEVKNKLSDRCAVKDLRWAIEHNRCFVNGKSECFGSKQISSGALISFFFLERPLFKWEKERVLYEDAHLIIYNKPIYLNSEDLSKLNSCFPVHRLDRDTSGAIILAKTLQVKTLLEEMFKNRSIHKEYLALVHGDPGKSGVISGNMKIIHRREGAVIWGMADQGIFSKTTWKKEAQIKDKSLLLCKPITGRTHQIRVHLKEIGFPILGDFVYGSKKIIESIFRPLLHAYRLRFCHPLTQKELIVLAPLPKDFPNIKNESVFT